MQYSTLLTLAAAAFAAGSSAFSIPRQAQQANFTVTDFFIQSGPEQGSDTEVVNYSWFLQSSTSSDAASLCRASTTPTEENGLCPTTPAIAGIQDAPCQDSAWHWSFTYTESPTDPPQYGYLFSLNYTNPSDGSTLSGCRFIIDTDFQCANGFNDYTGPQDFNITATDSSECILA